MNKETKEKIKISIIIIVLLVVFVTIIMVYGLSLVTGVTDSKIIDKQFRSCEWDQECTSVELTIPAKRSGMFDDVDLEKQCFNYEKKPSMYTFALVNKCRCIDNTCTYDEEMVSTQR